MNLPPRRGAGLGVALALGFKLDGPGELGYKAPYPVVNYILTGLVIGGGFVLAHAVFGLAKAKVSK